MTFGRNTTSLFVQTLMFNAFGDAFGFSPARYPEHDACFELSGGPHAAMRCGSCHASVTHLVASGACMTNNATCTGCHEHSCARTDRRHAQVPGYQCKDRKCYECHRFSTRSP